MPMKRLTFETLGEIAGGNVPTEFNRLLDMATEDIEERGGIIKGREITIRVILSPSEHKKPDGNPDGVDARVVVYSAVPKGDIQIHAPRNQMGERVIRGEVRPQMMLFFNPVARENPNQLTLDDASQQKASE